MPSPLAKHTLMGMITTRFAPSPTGRLHVGNIRTALLNWLFAHANEGRFLLRLDDTDDERSTEAYAEAIREDLTWLGIDAEGEVRQSERFDLYERAFERLRAAGRIYPAYESAEELELKRKVQLSRGLPPVYDRAALGLSAEDREAFERRGVRPHWRFRLDTGAPIVWHDLVRGDSHFEPSSLSDPVVRRADGSWLYMLPSVVDDIDMGITHVVRGEDHVTNSGVQLQMFAALGAAPPVFAHTSLLVGTEGKLSKRAGSIDMAALRSAGIEPVALAALLARLGTSKPVEPAIQVKQLAHGFDFGDFGRAAARFDIAELEQLNAKIVHQLSYDQVADRLPEGMGPDAWLAVRPNLATVDEAADWWSVIEGPVTAAVDEADRHYLQEAAILLRDLEWSDDIWERWTEALKASTGRKGRALFRPLRLALTGRDQGPEMARLLPMIGRERALRRLAS